MGIFSPREPLHPAYVRGRQPDAARWTVTFSANGFINIPIPWDGESWEAVVESFLAFLEDEGEVLELDPWAVPRPGYRRVRTRFQGVANVLVFRPEWVAGFIVEGKVGR